MSQNGKNQNSSSFLSGVVLGGVAGSIGLYLLGTDKGREKLRKIIDACENIEDIVKEHEKDFKNKKNHENTIVSDVKNLMSKLESILPEHKP